MRVSYELEVRHNGAFLEAIMRELAGNAKISFEGDLKKCRFEQVPNASQGETSALKRNTIFPRQDFIVLPLEEHTIDSILAQILPEHRFEKEIIHIQIEKNNALELGIYDNFSPHYVFAEKNVSPQFLDALVLSEILTSYEKVELNN